MDEIDNLPFGTTHIDGSNAGVSRWDDRQTAFAKVATSELVKQNARVQEHYESGRTSHIDDKNGKSNFSAGGGQSASGISDLNRSLMRSGNIMSVSHLANIIEGERLALLNKRQIETKAVRTWRMVAGLTLAVAVLIVFLGKLPFVPYKYWTVEYIGVRILLVGSVYLFFKSSSYISKAITPKEKRLNVIAECMIAAIKSSYDGTFEKVKYNAGKHYDYLLGRFYAPKKDITAKFLFEFNKNIYKKTGDAMPYPVYKFRLDELWNRAIFVEAEGGSLDEFTAPYADPVSLAELERLANQPA